RPLGIRTLPYTTLFRSIRGFAADRMIGILAHLDEMLVGALFGIDSDLLDLAQVGDPAPRLQGRANGALGHGTHRPELHISLGHQIGRASCRGGVEYSLM